jgi:predicted RNA binding protein YcfA (HicA-like mRNA interferase family)
MPRIISLNWKILIRVFELYGCTYKRKKGSHHILLYPGAKRAVVIPEYDEVDVEIIKSNI